MGAYKTTCDTPEQIACCLNCPFKECVDCIGNGKSPKDVLEYRKRKRHEVNSREHALLKAYAACDSVKEMAGMLGKKPRTVEEYLRRACLPKPEAVTSHTRRTLVELCLGEE